MIGTALVAGGAAALNQVWERDTDRLMRRTSRRPIASGRLHGRARRTWFGIAARRSRPDRAGACGQHHGGVGRGGHAHQLRAVLHAAEDALVTVHARRRGARARCRRSSAGPRRLGDIGLPAVVLFGIVFFWQMPHFLAIAWMHRDDYARAGIPLLPVLEPDGRRTGQQALQYTLALGPVSLMPVLVGHRRRVVRRDRRVLLWARHALGHGPVCPASIERARAGAVPLLARLPVAALDRPGRRSSLALGKSTPDRLGLRPSRTPQGWMYRSKIAAGVRAPSAGMAQQRHVRVRSWQVTLILTLFFIAVAGAAGIGWWYARESPPHQGPIVLISVDGLQAARVGEPHCRCHPAAPA